VADTRRSPSFQRKLESRGGGVDSGSRPAALPGMTKQRTRSVFHALCTKRVESQKAVGGRQLAPRRFFCVWSDKLLSKDFETKPLGKAKRWAEEGMLSLRGAADDEAISAEDKDCFAPLAMTP
jgi:hypothetical protein